MDAQTRRVTLIIPPSGFLIDERVFPSLGVLKVAASLERVGVGVNVIDLSGVQHQESRLAVSTIHSTVGITATMPQMPAAFKIAGWLRGHTRARLILGGPHPTLLQASVRNGSTRA